MKSLPAQPSLYQINTRVWLTGPSTHQVSRSHPEWRKEFQGTLPDLREKDIAESGFAITGYTAHSNLGGDVALARLRERPGLRHSPGKCSTCARVGAMRTGNDFANLLENRLTGMLPVTKVTVSIFPIHSAGAADHRARDMSEGSNLRRFADQNVPVGASRLSPKAPKHRGRIPSKSDFHGTFLAHRFLKRRFAPWMLRRNPRYVS